MVGQTHNTQKSWRLENEQLFLSQQNPAKVLLSQWHHHGVTSTFQLSEKLYPRNVLSNTLLVSVVQRTKICSPCTTSTRTHL